MAAGQAAQAGRPVEADGAGGDGAGGGVARRAVAQAGDDPRAAAALQCRQGVREPGLPLRGRCAHRRTFPLSARRHCADPSRSPPLYQNICSQARAGSTRSYAGRPGLSDACVRGIAARRWRSTPP